ncbi:AlpA family phage regulatory protein [Shewanella sp. SG41-4]|uniref:helix-turn-helix transcriptional regulator n=1 Tax=Shewanella sp. SG41-4 TaxID=2760976 RepID=UPI0016007E34|nr:AlpA family phage regulatory protein [Shewanella sp. SG41-4]MBB1440288.1 AlpA family phage regulatory protein [Shewanella sp. SG41-4]
MPSTRIIKYPEMEQLTGRDRRTLWRWWQKDQIFPKPLMQNGRAIGWSEDQYSTWLASLEAANS